MTTLKVGIADYEEMKARTMRIARGEHRGQEEPDRRHEPEQLATDAPTAHRDTLRIAGCLTAVTGMRRSTGSRIRSALSA